MCLRKLDDSGVLMGEKWNWKIGLHLNIRIRSLSFKTNQQVNKYHLVKAF